MDLDSLCKECKGLCCKHVALQIDNPTEKHEFDQIRWYLLHQNVNVYIDDEDDWFVEFKTVCSKLDDEGRCTIYETRPEICRDYPGEDDCEYSGESYYKKFFKNAAEFEEWLLGADALSLMKKKNIFHRWGGFIKKHITKN